MHRMLVFLLMVLLVVMNSTSQEVRLSMLTVTLNSIRTIIGKNLNYGILVYEKAFETLPPCKTLSSKIRYFIALGKHSKQNKKYRTLVFYQTGVGGGGGWVWTRNLKTKPTFWNVQMEAVKGMCLSVQSHF